jgi:hypothetical protein
MRFVYEAINSKIKVSNEYSSEKTFLRDTELVRQGKYIKCTNHSDIEKAIRTLRNSL